ncbi:MAG: hypothetical protein WCJ33_05880 [Pseudomonadota bacterium]
MKNEKITYPEWINEVGMKIGMHRAESNRTSDINKPSNVRPDDYNVRGAIGELIFMIYLERNGYEYEFNKFFADAPVSDYDVVIDKDGDSYYIDVKCLSKETEILNVTFDAHNNNNKRVNGYAFVKLHGNNEASIYKFKKEEISDWEVMVKNRENGQSKFYGKKI